MLHPFHLLMLPDQQFLDVMICRSCFNVDFLEVIQWKRTQFSDVYTLCRRIQFLNRQKSKNSMSLSFLVLLVSLSNFVGSFDMLAAYQTYVYCWFSGLCSLWFLPLGDLNNTLLQEPIFTAVKKLGTRVNTCVFTHFRSLSLFIPQNFHGQPPPLEPSRY